MKKSLVLFLHFQKYFVLIITISALIIFKPTGSYSGKVDKVGLYGIWEIGVNNSKFYSNPFDYKEVELQSNFTSPSGKKYLFFGFFDGDGKGGQLGNTWKLRFMPNEIGIWTYTYKWTDGSPGNSGSFECIKSNLHGPVRVYQNNPYWFAHADGTPFFLNAIKYIFIERLNEAERAHLIKVLNHKHRFNAVVGPHVKSEDSDGGSFDRWISDPYWEGFNNCKCCKKLKGWKKSLYFWIKGFNNDRPCAYHSRYSLRFWKRMDEVLKDLGEAGMILIPFGMVGGTNSSRVELPCTSELRRQFARYWTARWGAYWNATFQPQSEYEENKVLKNGGIREICEMIEQTDPWHHLISVHSLNVATKLAGNIWYDYFTVQGSGYNNSDQGFKYNQQAIELHKMVSKPVFFHECIWEGVKNNTPTGNDPNVIRRSAWQMVIGGGATCYSDQVLPTHWSRHTYEVKNQPLGKSYHYLDIIYNFMTARPYLFMKPHNELLSSENGDGISCLSDLSNEYIIFFHKGGSVLVDLTSSKNKMLNTKWFNSRTGAYMNPYKVVGGRKISFTSPDLNDWVLLITTTENSFDEKTSLKTN